MYSYNAANYDPNAQIEYTIIPVGRHRVRIAEACFYTSPMSGNDSIKIKFDVSGYSGKLWTYISLKYTNDEEKRKVDQRVGDFMNKFGLSWDPSFSSWVGKVGACEVKHDMYNGSPSAKIKYFLKREDTESLPAWQEKTAMGNMASSYSYEPSPAPATFTANGYIDISSMSGSPAPADGIPF